MPAADASLDEDAAVLDEDELSVDEDAAVLDEGELSVDEDAVLLLRVFPACDVTVPHAARKGPTVATIVVIRGTVRLMGHPPIVQFQLVERI
jgi:hypothetical protein